MNPYLILADIVVVLHLAYVLFVILGLVAVGVGYIRKWRWVRNRWFRLIHLSMITIVVVESLLSITCPLTTLENWFRRQAGGIQTSGSFVGRLAHELLFINLSPGWFPILYCGFGAAVLATFLLVPIQLRRARPEVEPHGD